MGHTSHAHRSEVDRICSTHLASGQWSLEWVGHAAIWDTPTGSHPLVVRLSAPESHESQRLLTQKGVTDSHQSHCHRQQCLQQVIANDCNMITYVCKDML